MRLVVLCFIASALPALAQSDEQHQRALPFIIEQRNNALDGVALCSGDMDFAKSQIKALNANLEAVRAELKAAKAELAKQKDAPQ